MKTISFEKRQRRAEYEANPFKNPRHRFGSADKFKWRQQARYYSSRGIGIAETRTKGHIDSIAGNYSFELVWGQARGSKLRAYRLARQIASRNNGQSCACPMATPKGFLP